MTAAPVGIRVFAKINLFLRILRRRDDGFHDIETVMHPIGLFDELEVEALDSERFELAIEGDHVPLPADNTVVRAWNAMRRACPERVGGCRARLRKGIPSEAGLGGASADGAGALLALNRTFDAGLSEQRLIALAAEIGSDTPFFLGAGPAVARGRGEHLEPLEGSLNRTIHLALTPKGVSTPEAYSRFRPDASENGRSAESMVQAVEAGDIAAAADGLFNTFERLVFPGRPDLKAIRSALLKAGARGAAMSGSGSTMFAIGLTPRGARQASADLQAEGSVLRETTLEASTYQWLPAPPPADRH